MIRVRVKIVGALAKPLGKDEYELELQDDSRLESLLLEAGYHAGHLRFIIPVVNGAHERLSYVLQNGDNVQLFLPTSGG